MSKNSMPYWIEWRLTCALDRCNEQAQVELRGFVARRFAGYVRALDFRVGLPAAHDDELPDAWLLFEEKMLADKRRDGRLYKVWIFDRLKGRTASEQETIESGASMRLRDWARQWWNEKRRPLLRACSLDEPVGSDPNAATRGDLLRSLSTPADDVVLKECEQAAQGLAGSVFRTLNARERMTVLAKMHGLNFSNPAVEQAFGCKKTVLYETFEEASRKVTSLLASEYPEESPGTLAFLEMHYARALGDLVLAWCRAEESCESLFTLTRHEVSHDEIAEN